MVNLFIFALILDMPEQTLTTQFIGRALRALTTNPRIHSGNLPTKVGDMVRSLHPPDKSGG
jgi:hypothetical protein